MERKTVLHINDAILHTAFKYAESKGMDLSAIIESYLVRMVSMEEKEKIKNYPISDKVRSLAGRMKANASLFDLENEKEKYLKEKYGL